MVIKWQGIGKAKVKKHAQLMVLHSEGSPKSILKYPILSKLNLNCLSHESQSLKVHIVAHISYEKSPIISDDQQFFAVLEIRKDFWLLQSPTACEPTIVTGHFSIILPIFPNQTTIFPGEKPPFPG